MPHRKGWRTFVERWNGGLRDAVAPWVRRILTAGVLIFLVKQLAEVGWGDIVQNLPVHPMFYVLFLGIYMGLPVAETVIYRILWRLPFRQSFPVLLKKRVYNKEVLNYSGEAHLYVWAKNNLDKSGRVILRDLKDNAILSSLSSMVLASSLLGIFLLAGLLPFDAVVGEVNTWWLVGGGFVVALIAALAVRFRKAVIALPASTALALFGLHLGRVLSVQVFQFFQWMIIMPEVPWSVWFTLLSVQIVVNQLPLIPAKDLVVLGASAELTGWLDVSEAGVMGMLLVAVVLDKVLNLILFAYLSWKERRTKMPPAVFSDEHREETLDFPRPVDADG